MSWVMNRITGRRPWACGSGRKGTEESARSLQSIPSLCIRVWAAHQVHHTHLHLPNQFVLVRIREPLDGCLAEYVTEVYKEVVCNGVQGEWMEYNSPTQEIFAVLGFSQLCLKRLEAVFARLEEAYTFHVRHAVALLVINLVGEVYLVGKQC